MKQKSLQEVVRVLNIAIKTGYPVEAQWDAGSSKIKLSKAEYERDENGEHIYGYDTEGNKHCIGGASVRQYSPDAVPFVWSAKEGCSW
jgi:hypothetical protein